MIDLKLERVPHYLFRLTQMAICGRNARLKDEARRPTEGAKKGESILSKDET